jgi:hypothetical protein
MGSDELQGYAAIAVAITLAAVVLVIVALSVAHWIS